MAKQLTVNIPTQPEGAIVEVVGLGLIENGTTVDVPDDRVVEYEATHGTLEDTLDLTYEAAPEGPSQAIAPDAEVADQSPVVPEEEEGPVTLNEMQDQVQNPPDGAAGTALQGLVAGMQTPAPDGGNV
jgi:hypothetical protein